MVPDPIPDWFELRRRARVAKARVRRKPKCLVETEKPCWIARCRYSLLKDEAKGGKEIRETFPDKSPAELKETCSVRAARNGVLDGDEIRDLTMPEIAEMMGMSTQNARLAMLSAFAKIAQIIEPGQLVRYWKQKRLSRGEGK